MKNSLAVGDVHVLELVVTDAQTVPNLYPQAAEFQAMPKVFATGFLVGLLEWACIEALKPHLDEGEGSLGTAIAITHLSPTPPGMKVTVTATCIGTAGRSAEWRVEARDERDLIAEGTHGRAIVRWDRFLGKLSEKTAEIAR